MKKLIIAFSLILFSATSNAEVFQCKVNGSLVFQDKPCAGSKEQQTQIREKQNAYKTAKYEKEKREADWASRKEPKLGMTTSQAEKSTWGYPDKTNRTTGVYGVKEQWVYQVRPGLSKYLYFDNGILTTIQDY